MWTDYGALRRNKFGRSSLAVNDSQECAAAIHTNLTPVGNYPLLFVWGQSRAIHVRLGEVEVLAARSRICELKCGFPVDEFRFGRSSRRGGERRKTSGQQRNRNYTEKVHWRLTIELSGRDAANIAALGVHPNRGTPRAARGKQYGPLQ